MALYELTVEETLSRTVKVEADSYDDAKEQVLDAYQDGKIILDWSDYLEVDIF